MNQRDRARHDLKHASGLEARALSCYRSDYCLFEDVDLRIDAGQLVRIEGANGSGKTSLLRILAGLSRPDHGEVLWEGLPIDQRRSGYQGALGYLGHLLGLKLDLTLDENLRLMAALRGGCQDLAAIDRVLSQLGLLSRRSLRARVLSQGQRQRAALAALSLFGGTLWIMDEPYTALDAEGIQLAEALIDAHLEQGGMVILTSHQTPSTRVDARRFSL